MNHFKEDSLNLLSLKIADQLGYDIQQREKPEKMMEPIKFEEISPEHKLLSNIDNLTDDKVEKPAMSNNKDSSPKKRSKT
jgi:hypothetical protein